MAMSMQALGWLMFIVGLVIMFASTGDKE
jgi:hypothetical protein